MQKWRHGKNIFKKICKKNSKKDISKRAKGLASGSTASKYYERRENGSLAGVFGVEPRSLHRLASTSINDCI